MSLIEDKALESKRDFCRADFLGSGKPVLQAQRGRRLFTQTVDKIVAKYPKMHSSH
jgi:hypothetical protein